MLVVVMYLDWYLCTSSVIIGFGLVRDASGSNLLYRRWFSGNTGAGQPDRILSREYILLEACARLSACPCVFSGSGK